MSKQTRVSHPLYSLLSTDAEGFDSLAGLALDMRWSWDPAAAQVWQQLDPAIWELTHNLWGILQTLSLDQIERVSADPIFRKRIDELVQARRQTVEIPAWFQQTYPQSPLTAVAYFSMEFMLSGAPYGLLEREVILEFYTRDANGIPATWVERMRESMARLTPRFSTNRWKGKTCQDQLPARLPR